MATIGDENAMTLIPEHLRGPGRLLRDLMIVEYARNSGSGRRSWSGEARRNQGARNDR